jgi:hypothetical protein
MLHRKLAVLALLILLVPSLVEAQRRSRTRGDKEANWDAIEQNASSGPRFSAKDIEGLSAIRILVDKRKDLKLSDEQAKQLRDLGKKEDDATKAQFAVVDSLKTALRSRAGSDPDAERARVSIAQQELMNVIGQIRASYDATFKEALPLLDEPQQKAATALVEKERADAEEELREKISSGRGGPITRTKSP